MATKGQNKVSTTQRSMNQLEMLHRNKPSRDTNRYACSH